MAIGYNIGKGLRFVAGTLTIGTVYEIETLGTTDFTLIGALSNEECVVFTATGVGSGTGTVKIPHIHAWVPSDPTNPDTYEQGDENNTSMVQNDAHDN